VDGINHSGREIQTHYILQGEGLEWYTIIKLTSEVVTNKINFYLIRGIVQEKILIHLVQKICRVYRCEFSIMFGDPMRVECYTRDF